MPHLNLVVTSVIVDVKLPAKKIMTYSAFEVIAWRTKVTTRKISSIFKSKKSDPATYDDVLNNKAHGLPHPTEVPPPAYIEDPHGFKPFESSRPETNLEWHRAQYSKATATITSSRVSFDPTLVSIQSNNLLLLASHFLKSSQPKQGTFDRARAPYSSSSVISEGLHAADILSRASLLSLPGGNPKQDNNDFPNPFTAGIPERIRSPYAATNVTSEGLHASDVLSRASLLSLARGLPEKDNNDSPNLPTTAVPERTRSPYAATNITSEGLRACEHSRASLLSLLETVLQSEGSVEADIHPEDRVFYMKKKQAEAAFTRRPLFSDRERRPYSGTHSSPSSSSGTSEQSGSPTSNLSSQTSTSGSSARVKRRSSTRTQLTEPDLVELELPLPESSTSQESFRSALTSLDPFEMDLDLDLSLAAEARLENLWHPSHHTYTTSHKRSRSKLTSTDQAASSSSNTTQLRRKHGVRRKSVKECTVCGEPQSMDCRFPTHKITSTCKHQAITCKSCIRKWISSQLDSTTWDQLHCPECPELLQHNDVRRHASSAEFKRYDALSLASFLSSTPDILFTCLSPTCKSSQLHPAGTETPIFTCASCSVRSCVSCRVLWHADLTCTAYQADLAARIAADKEERRRRKEREEEERESEAQVSRMAKTCPNGRCGARIEKNGGCDHMTCRKCKHEFCWLCFADYTEIRRVGNTAHALTSRYYA